MKIQTKIKICRMCGKAMPGVGRARKWCSECRRRLELERKKEYNERKKQEMAAASASKPTYSIAEMLRFGKALHMTYGQTEVWLRTHDPSEIGEAV